MSRNRDSRYNYAANMNVMSVAGQLLEPVHRDIRKTLTRINYPDNRKVRPNIMDNWSRVAWRTLGDGRRWWIIADFSQIIDPLSELLPEVKLRYLARPLEDIPAGTVASITVDRPDKLARAMRIRVEDLDLSAAQPNYFDASILDVNMNTGVINITPVVVTNAIPSALSRVSEIRTSMPVLTVPALHRATNDAVDFRNRLNTLVGG